MRVGVFGGSFNPPHVGHLIIAETIREEASLDQVLWMPTASPPHKADTGLVPFAHRLEMTARATAGHPQFDVSDLEGRRTGPSYTVDTVRTLREQYPDRTFALIIGGDSLQGFSSWHEPDLIIEKVSLLVYPRRSMDLSAVAPRYLNRTHVIEAPLLDLSSTAIRDRCRQGRSIRYLVPEHVRTYIISHKLYPS